MRSRHFKSLAEFKTTHTDDILCIRAPATGFMTPKNARTTDARFSATENAMFVLIVIRDAFDKFTAYGMAVRSVPAIYICADSIARSFFSEATAMEESALARAGASFTPSPIMQTFSPLWRAFDIISSFWAGRTGA